MTFFNPNLTEHSDAAYHSEQSGPSMQHFAVVAEVNLYSLPRPKFSQFNYNSQTDKIDVKI